MDKDLRNPFCAVSTRWISLYSASVDMLNEYVVQKLMIRSTRQTSALHFLNRERSFAFSTSNQRSSTLHWRADYL